MKPIKIEPGSGTKLAGKWIGRSGWPALVKILFVGSKKVFVIHQDGNEYDFSIECEGEEWFEVDPPASEKPKMVRRTVFLKAPVIGESDVYKLSTLSPFEPFDSYGCNIVIVQEDGNEIRGKMFVEVPVEGEKS